jgi:membrane-associated phospholipid phosphatase
VLSVAIAATTLLGATHASADEPRRRDVQLTMLGNGFYDAGFIALNVTGLVVGTYLIHPGKGDVAPLDGLGHRPRVQALERASDFALGIGLGTGVGLAFLSEMGHGSRGADLFRGPTVITEGMLAGTMLTQLLKNVFGVCRPRDWNDQTARCEMLGETNANDADRKDEAHRSFPSGHNAPLAGMAGAAFGLYLLPQPDRAEYLPVALSSLGFALTVVVLRERAGAHSWIDTVGAFLSGGAAGLATAALHVHTTKSEPTAAAPGAMSASAPMIVSFGAPF